MFPHGASAIRINQVRDLYQTQAKAIYLNGITKVINLKTTNGKTTRVYVT
jgi:hypothetical protein